MTDPSKQNFFVLLSFNEKFCASLDKVNDRFVENHFIESHFQLIEKSVVDHFLEKVSIVLYIYIYIVTVDIRLSTHMDYQWIFKMIT